MKEFELFPIGFSSSEQSGAMICILPAYRKALKYLDLFSHAIIFYKSDKSEESELNDALIKIATVKIGCVDCLEGIIQIDCFTPGSGTPIFDIKPYFPGEDRVEKCFVPERLEKLSEWREEKEVFEADNHFPAFIQKNLEYDTFYAQQIGVIKKQDGITFLKLNNSSIHFTDMIKEFSHIKIVWWFDRFDKKMYRRATDCKPPYENAPRTGIFATRSPVRPNPIAMTTVRVLNCDRDSGTIKISHTDSFDNTPLIGIFPYIPAYDRIKSYRLPEWLRHWPQWLDEQDSNINIDSMNPVQSDIIKIEKYLSAGLQDEERDKSFFKEYRSADNSSDNIIIKGARQNNLKGINCSIPKNNITVITGVSGSGKSSLAFDTIFAESQRRFMDCMSVSGRAVFEQMEKPDFDQIAGLPPAVAIEQKTVGRNPRSTVGTMTDVYDYLRLLYSKIGTRHCPECGKAVKALKTDEILEILGCLIPGTCFSIKAYNSKDCLGEFVAGESSILKECVLKALDAGNGAIEVVINNTEAFILQTKEKCYNCDRVFFELTASDFSFNNPESMCPVCKGLGVRLEIDTDLIISNPNLSILDGASEWWGNLRKHMKNLNANWMRGEVLALAEDMKVDLELPWRELPESFKHQALYGSEGREVSLVYENANGRKGEIVRPVEGAYNAITRLFRENNGDTANRIAVSFMRESRCSSCHGERLNAEGRLVSVAGRRFPETVTMTIEQLRNWIMGLSRYLSEYELKVCGQILREIKNRLDHLIDVGVPYLSLDRPVPSLSGGEAQRLRLASQLGSGISNILYIFDEPSIGLHPKDHGKLIRLMQKLRDCGNTVVVVEHDADTMLAADKIIDIGPGAGDYGGKIIGEGTPDEIINNINSKTGTYLRNLKNNIKNSIKPRKPEQWISIKGARCNNLKNIDVSIPLGVITCVTGVSGSGKSSLIIKTLYPALARLVNKSDAAAGEYDSITGVENIENIISVSQQPIGRTPRSNPATYTGVFDDIRNLFADLPEAKQKGYKSNKFSFNSKEGQCGVCGGEGKRCLEMHFMPDVWVECPVCHGKRFNKEALEVKYKEKTIADILDMNVSKALNLFKCNKKISKVLQTLEDVGLGYIQLGQSALTLSGGEAQRIKLAKELSRENSGKTIYLLDEPTTGLHFSDVENLIMIMRRITDAGHSVLIIEHNLEIIKNSDWIIDLGPDGGDAGGFVVAQGTPIEVAQVSESHTGKCLKSILGIE